MTDYVYIGYSCSDISGQIPILQRLDLTEILFCVRKKRKKENGKSNVYNQLLGIS